MNKKETAQIITILQANYPDSFRTMDDRMMQMTVNLWETIFADDDYREVQAAVIAHIATDTGRYMPPVGVIKNALVKLREPQEMTEAEAWALVAQAIKRSSIYAAEEFDKLPDICKRLVGSASQLREWAITPNLNIEVVSSNFMRSYKARLKNDREFAALPQTVKALMLEQKSVMLLE